MVFCQWYEEIDIMWITGNNLQQSHDTGNYEQYQSYSVFIGAVHHLDHSHWKN